MKEDPLHNIIQGLITIASVFKNQSSNPRDNIFISGILPRNESFSVNVTNEVTDLLKFK